MKLLRYSTELQIDFQALETLVQQMPNISLSGDELKAYLNKLVMYGELFVALEGLMPNALLGFYANNLETKIAFLSCIVVSAKLQGSGVGQSLFSQMCSIAKEKGMTRLQLDVVKENVRAIAFYKRNDCVIVGEGRTDEYWLMEKSL